MIYFRQKGSKHTKKKKIANELKSYLTTAQMSKNKKKNRKSSNKKKVSAWIGTGRRRDQEQKSSFLYADVKRRNRESQSIPHENQWRSPNNVNRRAQII